MPEETIFILPMDEIRKPDKFPGITPEMIAITGTEQKARWIYWQNGNAWLAKVFYAGQYWLFHSDWTAPSKIEWQNNKTEREVEMLHCPKQYETAFLPGNSPLRQFKVGETYEQHLNYEVDNKILSEKRKGLLRAAQGGEVVCRNITTSFESEYPRTMAFLRDNIVEITSEDIESNKMPSGMKASKAIRKGLLASDALNGLDHLQLPAQAAHELNMSCIVDINLFIQRIFDRASSLQETVYISTAWNDMLQAAHSTVFDSCMDNTMREEPCCYSAAPVAMALSPETLIAYVNGRYGLKKRIWIYLNRHGFALGRHYGQWTSEAIDAIKVHCKYLVQSLNEGISIPKWYVKTTQISEITDSAMVYDGDDCTRYAITRGDDLEINIPHEIPCLHCNDWHMQESKNGLCNYCHDELERPTIEVCCHYCGASMVVTDDEHGQQELWDAGWYMDDRGAWYCEGCHFSCDVCDETVTLDEKSYEIDLPHYPAITVCEHCFDRGVTRLGD